MKNISFLLLLFFPFFTFSQTVKKEKTLSKEEINFAQCSFEPSAPAVVLNDFTDYWFDTNPNGKNLFLFIRQRIRIKILTEGGLKYAKIKIPYHNMHCEEFFGDNTFNVKGYTYNVSADGKVSKIKLKNKTIIYKDSTNCTSYAVVQMPEVKVGSVIEYTVTQPTLDFEKPATRYLQYDIPVIFSQTVFDVPRYFTYLFPSDSYSDMELSDQKSYNRILNYSFKINFYGRMRNVNENIDVSGTSFIFELKNIPSYKKSVQLYSDNEYRKKISPHLKSFRNDNTTDYGWKQLTYALVNTLYEDYDRLTPGQRKMNPYPAGFFGYNLPTWKELNQNLLNSQRFGIALVKFWNCKKLTDSLTAGISNDSLKVINIYNYVTGKIKWNGQYDIYADVSDNFFKKLYSKAGGSVKLNNIGKLSSDTTTTSSVINFMMMYLLKTAGIKVCPILISTPKNGKIDESIPDVKQFNNTIAEIEINQKMYYLDAATPNETFLNIPGNNEIRNGFRVNKDNFGIVDYNKPFFN